MPKSLATTLHNDPKAVTYEEAVQLVSGYLQTFPHGHLKKFAEEENPGLNYAGLVNLKNNKLQRPAPLAIQRLLQTIGFPADVQRTRDKETRQTGHQYTFKKKGGLTAFKEAFDKYVTNTRPADAEPGSESSTADPATK